MVDVWREVNRQFVDGTFNGLGEEGWKKKKLDTVKSLSASEVLCSPHGRPPPPSWPRRQAVVLLCARG